VISGSTRSCKDNGLNGYHSRYLKHRSLRWRALLEREKQQWTVFPFNPGLFYLASLCMSFKHSQGLTGWLFIVLWPSSFTFFLGSPGWFVICTTLPAKRLYARSFAHFRAPSPNAPPLSMAHPFFFSRGNEWSLSKPFSLVKLFKLRKKGKKWPTLSLVVL
jgi:hypothetical protein